MCYCRDVPWYVSTYNHGGEIFPTPADIPSIKNDGFEKTPVGEPVASHVCGKPQDFCRVGFWGSTQSDKWGMTKSHNVGINHPPSSNLCASGVGGQKRKYRETPIRRGGYPVPTESG